MGSYFVDNFFKKDILKSTQDQDTYIDNRSNLFLLSSCISYE